MQLVWFGINMFPLWQACRLVNEYMRKRLVEEEKLRLVCLLYCRACLLSYHHRHHHHHHYHYHYHYHLFLRTLTVLAWSALLSAELNGQISAFLRRLYKQHFTHSITDIEQSLISSHCKLFRNMHSVNVVSVVFSTPRKDNDVEL